MNIEREKEIVELLYTISKNLNRIADALERKEDK
jgi:hypothetical protein